MPYIAGSNRHVVLLFPEALDDYITEGNPVRFIDAFVSSLDLADLGFARAEPAATGRPAYDPADLLKLYIYGYLNRVRSARMLERETQRNVEVMWLLSKLTPDFKTIADFRKDNLGAIKAVCREFTLLCKKLALFSGELVAIDGSKFRAVNSRKRNFNPSKLARIIKSIDITYIPKAQVSPKLKKELFTKEDFRYDPLTDTYTCPAGEQLSHRFTTGERNGVKQRYYRTTACKTCAMRSRCTENNRGRTIKRLIDEEVLERMAQRLRSHPEKMRLRGQLVEHPFGTMKRGMNQGYFLLKGIKKVAVEMSLTVLYYNIKRVVNILGVEEMIRAVA